MVSSRLTTRVLSTGSRHGDPVLFLHGNLSSATWWESTLLTMPDGYFAVALDQRGYGDADSDAIIDATRGMGDLSDDAVALLDVLGIERAVIVGNSMGGSVIWRMIADHADRITAGIVVDPGSPYGYGGTKDPNGVPIHEDFAGSGAGLVNPELVRRLEEGDRSTESPFSPRNVFRSLIVKSGFVAEQEDAYVEAMLSTHIGPHQYPGDAQPSPNWPLTAPGLFGAANGLSPRWAVAAETALMVENKPDILWIRGAQDLIISDAGPLDPAVWGPSDIVPGYPGPDLYPPQPMVSQTRSWLDHYAATGGSYQEAVLDNGGHVPFIDDAETVNGVFHAYLESIDTQTRRTE
jgi:pimeloyl-ACP methyl ester carboxylesterase